MELGTQPPNSKSNAGTDDRVSCSSSSSNSKCVLCKTGVAGHGDGHGAGVGEGDLDFESAGTGEFYQTWLNQISESILSLLSLGQEAYFPIFSTATYCQSCLQLVRDADWTYRTVTSLSSKLDDLKQEITSLFWSENLIVRQKMNTAATATPIRKLMRSKPTPRTRTPKKAAPITSTSSTPARARTSSSSKLVPKSPSPGPGLGSPRSLRERKVPAKYSEFQLTIKNEIFEDDQTEILPDFDNDDDPDADMDPLTSEPDNDDDDDFDDEDRKFTPARTPRSAAKPRDGLAIATRGSPKRHRLCTYEGCNFSATQDQHLKKHIENVHINPQSQKSFQCDIGDCEQKYSSFLEFKKHRSNDHNDLKKLSKNGSPLIRCEFPNCKYTSTVLKYLKTHVRRQHTGDPQPYACEQCEKSYSKSLYLREHELTHDPNYVKPTIPCTVPGCESVFLAQRSLRTHMACTHWDYQKIKCDLCWKLYEENERDKYDQHMSLHMNSAEPFACVLERCTAVLSCTSDLRNHYIKVHNPMRVECELCDQVCINEAHFASHMKNHRRKNRTQAENEPCSHPGCSYIPRSDYDRKTHLISHTDKKTYVCEECGNGFKWKSGLSSHMRIHQENNKPFKCLYPGCNQGFSLGQKLKLHEERAHSKLRPYVCHICAKAFKSKNDLGGHLKRTHGDMNDETVRYKRKELNRRRRESRLRLKEKQIGAGAEGQGASAAKRTKLSKKSQLKQEKPHLKITADPKSESESEEMETDSEIEAIETRVIHEVEVRDVDNAEEIYFPE